MRRGCSGPQNPEHAPCPPVGLSLCWLEGWTEGFGFWVLGFTAWGLGLGLGLLLFRVWDGQPSFCQLHKQEAIKRLCGALSLNPKPSIPHLMSRPQYEGAYGGEQMRDLCGTLHPTPYTLHPTPYTLHPTP